MKQTLTFIISLAVLTACGRTHQAATPEEETVSEALDASPEIAEEGIGPSESEAPPPEPAVSAGPPANESIVPPTQVSGAYLVARVLRSTDTTLDLGLTAFYKGERVSLKPDMYRSSWTISDPLDPGVVAELVPSVQSDQDQILQFTAESIKAIKDQLPLVQVILSVSDLVANKKEETQTQSVETALLETAKRDGVEAPLIEPMPEGLDPNL